VKKGLCALFLILISFNVKSLPEATIVSREYNTNQELSVFEEVKPVSGYNSEETSLTIKEEASDDEHAEVPLWAIIPFVVLLLMIATGPLFYEHFWHKAYPAISVILASTVVGYYVFGLHNTHSPIHSLFEYIQFISLLASLYVASGGIMINVDKKVTPGMNVLLLAFGAVIANLIGTTGASMLLIRPFIRLNNNRIKSYHIIFFIFIVSNIGGSLTPIGDPPLFLGFLKGVPFFWTLTHNFNAWIFAVSALLLAFYLIDRGNKTNYGLSDDQDITNKVSIIGSRNFIWLIIIILAVFIDPNVFEWVPAIEIDGTKFSFIREIIMLTTVVMSYKFANKEALKGNEFNFEPIREVAFIFVGIFGTMMPALEIVGNFAASPRGVELLTHNTLYWGTGLLSGFLDNAPTYINFVTASMASKGADIGVFQQVTDFANGGVYADSVINLMAISIAAVFFGAMTYIGNGPNFMVKSIAEQIGIKMPSFFGYLIRFAIPILLPLLFVVWLLFFYFQIF